ncbi:MAG: hypothetical protein GY801_10055 [bacterium]|nr:hypothetical protein [bacterium]
MCTTIIHQRAVPGVLLFILVCVLAPALTTAQESSAASEEFIATKLEEIVGIWKTQLRGMPAYIQYGTDGTSRLAFGLENLQTTPLLKGKIWFEGNIFHQQNDDPVYSEDVPGKYEIRVHKEEGIPVSLSFRVIDDANKIRSNDLIQGVKRVETAARPPGKIATQVEDLVGVWETRTRGMKAYIQYRADGTYSIAYAPENLQSSPLSSGEVWFEENIYHDKNHHPLAPDSPGKYEVRVHTEEGMPARLSFQAIDDAISGRVKDLSAGMTRVEP